MENNSDLEDDIIIDNGKSSTDTRFKPIIDKILKIDNLRFIPINNIDIIPEYHESWDKIFNDKRLKDEIININKKLNFIDINSIIPNNNSIIWNSFKKTPFPPSVIIFGQDPYIKREEAMGLSFSVPNGVKCPPSLINIFKEINEDMNTPLRKDTDLSDWAQQGVLLLNTALTTEIGKSGSHIKIWENFTNLLIQLICEKSSHMIVFLLWGNFAKSKEKFITISHKKLDSGHPSPLNTSSSSKFSGCKHFSKTNELLISKNLKPIIW